MNAEHVDQIFSEPPTVEERLTALEEKLTALERLGLVGEVYSRSFTFLHSDGDSPLVKAEARISELEAELELEKAKNKHFFNGGSGISPIKLEPLAIYPL